LRVLRGSPDMFDSIVVVIEDAISHRRCGCAFQVINREFINVYRLCSEVSSDRHDPFLRSRVAKRRIPVGECGRNGLVPVANLDRTARIATIVYP
jgi:hypothetical protein